MGKSVTQGAVYILYCNAEIHEFLTTPYGWILIYPDNMHAPRFTCSLLINNVLW